VTPRSASSGMRPTSSDSSTSTPRREASERTRSKTSFTEVSRKFVRFMETCTMPRLFSGTPMALTCFIPPPEARIVSAIFRAASRSREARLML